MNDGQYKSLYPDDTAAPRRGRRPAAFAASLAAHLAVLAIIWCFAPAIAKPHGDYVLAYLVEIGSGGPGGGAPAPTAAIPIATPAVAPSVRKPHRTIRAARPVNRPAEITPPDSELASRAPMAASIAPPPTGGPPHNRAAALGSGVNGDGGGAGNAGPGRGDSDGDGAGGSAAHADYASNPPPPYPTIARRREQQGIVTLRVLVGADGAVERVEVAESSGFEALDEAAVATVRARWRFIAARRAGTAFDSWVLVPIRFALTEANPAR